MEKIIENHISEYRVFGGCNGFVDIASDLNDSIVSNISENEAIELINNRQNLIDIIIELSTICDHDKMHNILLKHSQHKK